GFGDALFDGFHRRFEIDDDSFLESLRFRHAEANRRGTGVAHGGDQRGHFRGTDVEAYSKFFSASHITFFSASSLRMLTITIFRNRRSTRTARGYCCWICPRRCRYLAQRALKSVSPRSTSTGSLVETTDTSPALLT